MFKSTEMSTIIEVWIKNCVPPNIILIGFIYSNKSDDKHRNILGWLNQYNETDSKTTTGECTPEYIVPNSKCTEGACPNYIIAKT